MKLLLITPRTIVLDEDQVVSIRGEDPTGTFILWPRHEDFVTALTVSVLTWRRSDGAIRHAGVRGGILTVERGDVTVTTPEAIVVDHLEDLQERVIMAMKAADAAEAKARRVFARFRETAVKELARMHRLDPIGRGH